MRGHLMEKELKESLIAEEAHKKQMAKQMEEIRLKALQRVRKEIFKN